MMPKAFYPSGLLSPDSHLLTPFSRLLTPAS